MPHCPGCGNWYKRLQNHIGFCHPYHMMLNNHCPGCGKWYKRLHLHLGFCPQYMRALNRTRGRNIR